MEKREIIGNYYYGFWKPTEGNATLNISWLDIYEHKHANYQIPYCKKHKTNEQKSTLAAIFFHSCYELTSKVTLHLQYNRFAWAINKPSLIFGI